jgi:hypothetical protein
VGVHALRKFDRWVEPSFTLLGNAWLTDFQTSFNKLDIPVVKSIVNDSFVFLDRYRACRVHNVATCFGVAIDAVNGGKDELLL